MKRRRPPLAFSIILISFILSGFAARAQESTPPLSVIPPAQNKANNNTGNNIDAASQGAERAALTPDQFKALLPGSAAELHLQDFLALKNKGPVVVIDLRARPRFAARHLKGAVNLPLTELTAKTLPGIAPDKNTPVVLACDYSFAPVRTIAMTLQAYPVLKSEGYANIYRLNLWDNPGGKMLSETELEKLLEFEGAAVKPPVK